MEALTTKIDSQFKEIKGEIKEMRDECNSCGGPRLSLEYEDKPMGGPKDEEANYAYGGYRGGGYRGNYYDGKRYAKFIDLIKKVRVNESLVDVLAGMPNYEKFLKDLVSNKSKMEQIFTAFLNEEFSAIVKNKLPPKPGNLGSFLIPYTIAEVPNQEEEVEDNFKELPLEENLRIKNSIQDPPTNLVMKPLPKHLEYAFREMKSLLLVVITSLLKDDENKRLVSVLKKDKEAFAWKTFDISGFSPSFCKHKINFENDAKHVIQRQRRLNLNMKEVVKKRLSNFSMLVSFTPSKIVLGYFQFRIELADQEKTTFTCPYGTYTYKRIPFDHSALKYMFSKQDAKPRLIRWILQLQEFDIEIKNKKGAENVVADHLSRLKNPHLKELRDDGIDDNFPDENLMNVSLTEEDKIPWFADFANYLVGKILRKGLTYAQRCKFFSELKHYFLDEPYLFKMCTNRMIRRYVYVAETRKILDECLHGPTGGHYGPSTASKKVFKDEAEALPTNDARVVINFFKKLFSRFGIPKAFISDRGEKQFLQLHELDELRLQAYENSKLYKARTKAYHDMKLRI
nr:reverse transcriptase domain-containing protein [Tanacetum cinerariifolium]